MTKELQKEPIRLRAKTLKNGTESLYLDIYWNGKRSYEFLKLYLHPGNSVETKRMNKENIQLANTIKGKRLIELRNKEYGFKSTYKIKTNFLDYFEAERINIYNMNKTYAQSWKSCLRHLRDFCSPSTTFEDVDTDFAQDFKEYLEKTAKQKPTKDKNKALSRNSKSTYYAIFCSCLAKAFSEKIIPVNPTIGIRRIGRNDTVRVHLTFEEVQKLANTKCRYDWLKRAFLFSCLTGLRKSDIEKMKWSEVNTQKEFTRIIFQQKKTESLEYLDISNQAAYFLGERGNPDDPVFYINYNGLTSVVLREWCAKAGINKQITFHSARHTFACTMIDLDTDIFVVSKLLGHKDIRTTQIYAKVVDKKKQEAIKKIPAIIFNQNE